MNAAIHDYIGRGWSIIPIRPGDKRPLVRWEEFQHRHPSEAEAGAWFYRWREAGIGIVTGAISGLVVIDVDVRHGGDVALEHLEREHGLSFAKTASASLGERPRCSEKPQEAED